MFGTLATLLLAAFAAQDVVGSHNDKSPPPALPGEAVGTAPGVTGEVRMQSAKQKGLLPRNVVVWLPPGYSSPLKAEQRYPVLYMHDGQNVFNPGTAFMGREWHADEVATDLIRKGVMPPIIIVGVWNSPERVADYTPDVDVEEVRGDNKPQGRGGEGARYLQWLATELKPFIDSQSAPSPVARAPPSWAAALAASSRLQRRNSTRPPLVAWRRSAPACGGTRARSSTDGVHARPPWIGCGWTWAIASARDCAMRCAGSRRRCSLPTHAACMWR